MCQHGAWPVTYIIEIIFHITRDGCYHKSHLEDVETDVWSQ